MIQNKKIALIVYTLSSGGIERVVSNQSILFTNMGYDVHLYVLDGKVNYPYKGKLHTYNIDKNNSYKNIVIEYYKLKNDLRKEMFFLIIDHRYRLNKFMEFLWYNIIYKNFSLIYYIHSADIDSYISSSIIRKRIKWISVSDGIKNIINHKFPQISVDRIYNEVNLNNSISKDDSFNEEFVLAVGRMDSSNVKQFDLLIDCYLNSELPNNNIHLYILGDGERLPILKNRVNNNEYKNLIHFKGFQSELVKYYTNAKFLILSSKYEGLAMVLIECLNCGTPVVSFDCNYGPNEIIKNEYNGLLVENQNKQKLTEAINRMINDKKLYEFCKFNAISSTQKFSAENLKIVWENLFNGIH